MSQREQTLGMWLGLLAVVVFAVTLPMTRLATGTTDDPQLSAWFITFGRAALAGKLLKDMGYAEVYNLGGFKDWKDAGGPVQEPVDPGM